MGFTRGGDVYMQENACKITLTRGQRGGYGWEIRYDGDSAASVVEEIRAADNMLRDTYLTEGGQE
jgi:hypothetical protein